MSPLETVQQYLTGRALLAPVVGVLFILTALAVFVAGSALKWWRERRELRWDAFVWGYSLPSWWSNQRQRMYLTERRIEREREEASS